MAVLSRIGALTTLQNAQAGAANGTALNVTEAMNVVFEVSGTFTGITANWEGSVDGGTTWWSIQAMPLATRTFAATGTTTGLYLVSDAQALTTVRARTTVSTPTGSMTVRALGGLVRS